MSETRAVEDIPPGLELDLAIAEMIGWRELYPSAWRAADFVGVDSTGQTRLGPRYSESMDAVWTVVQFMRKRRFDFVFSAEARGRWYCSFAPPPRSPSSSARGELAADVICRAALKAFAAAAPRPAPTDSEAGA